MREAPTIKLPGIEKIQLVLSLGLLINQAGVYGVKHRVVQDAAAESFGQLRKLLQKYGTVEMELQGEHFLVNKSRDGMALGIYKNLAERMQLHKITLLHFAPPGNPAEFQVWLELFSAYPRVLESQGGFLAALDRAKLRGIRARQVEWRVVGGRGTGDAADSGTPTAPSSAPRIDLQEALDAWELEFGGQSGDTLNPPAHTHADILAARLRAVARKLEANHALGEAAQSGEILSEINHIRSELSSGNRRAMEQIATLSDKLEADHAAVISLEARAREHGLQLQLTRAELIAQQAELIQEITQPLTVTAGVIEMLQAQKPDELGAVQQEMLSLAAESLKRVSQLAEYMRQMVGLPQGYTPDKRIVEDSYQ